MASTPTNAEIARAFDLLGALLEIDGADRHRVLAYRRGAERVRATVESVAAMASAGRAVDLPGIGKTLQDKIVELTETGTIGALDRLTERVPAGLAEIAGIEGIGPKRAKAAWDALGVSSPAELAAAAADGRLADVPGFGPKLVAAVVEAGDAPAPAARTLLAVALPVAQRLVEDLRAVEGVAAVEIAGSARRGRETVHDLDIVVAADDPEVVAAAVASHPAAASSLAEGSAKTTIETHGGLRIDVRVGPPESFGNLLQHLTGSAAHNIRLREMAVRQGRSVSEHGVTEADGTVVRHADEHALYAALGLPWIPPELREDRGELDGPVPDLVEPGDIRGDLHTHTIASDGRDTLPAMVAAAAARGYAYLAISDHSHGLGMVQGLDPSGVRRQWEAIDRLNDASPGIRVLKGIELEVLSDGRLDFEDDLLAGFDVVVASVHSSFRQGRETATKRLLRAIASPHVDIVGHPTGRRLGRREGLDLDLEEVFAACAASGTLLEINGQGERLDLSADNARRALEVGCRLVVSSDAHSTGGLAGMDLAVLTARRAGARADQIANTAPSWPPG